MNETLSISTESRSAAFADALSFSFLKGGGGGGGGHSPRLLSVALAGLTALITIPSPAGAVNECGNPVDGAVTCSDPTYDNGIRYNQPLTLTVQPSGEKTTITASSTARSGIYLNGTGTLKVILDGKVEIVNGMPRATRQYGTAGTFINHAHEAGTTKNGIEALAYDPRKTGEKLEIEVVVGSESMIGTAETPVGRHGVLAYMLDNDRNDQSYPNGDIRVTNEGKVYGHFVGIQADHQGSGDITINTEKGSVTEMGIWAQSARGGNITIRNHGRVDVKDRVRYAVTRGSRIIRDTAETYARAGIYVRSTDVTTGTNAAPSSTILITSDGDIDITETTSYRFGIDGIEVLSTGDEDSVVPITVDVTGGTIKAGDRSGSGIKIDSRHRGGLIKVDFAGTIARTGPTGDGIYVYRALGAAAPHATIKESDIQVTFKAGAMIGVDGDESTVGQHGARLEQIGHGGSIETTVEEGARIGTEGTPVGGDGVWSRIVNHPHVGDIRVTNHGFIHAKGSGVYAWHQGQGDVVVKHERGTIKAGDAAGEFGKVGSEDSLPDLESRTAGIFAFHGGGETLKNEDGTIKTGEIGKIHIVSQAAVESKGNGIFAYVKDLDSSESVSTIVPITIEVMGGTIAAKRTGIRAENASADAGKIAVTVGERATVESEGGAGVHVGGGETRMVTIQGRVMGGGDTYAGVRMVLGGTLVIGTTAEIGAKSGIAALADGALTVTLQKDARGRIAWIKNTFVNTAGMTTDFGDISVGDTVTAVSGARTLGVYEAGTQRRVTLEKATANSQDTYQFKLKSSREYREYHDRARVYEALPSVLLDLNRQTSPHARLSARRDGNGGWARVWFGDGEREADRSTTEAGEKGHALSWDFERWGAEMGFDIPTSTEGLLLGVSAHYRDGRADVEHGGRIDASGFGFGVSATYRAEEGLYVDGQVSYTRFDDIDLSSDERGRLASGLDADGYAVGLEVGRRMEMAERNVVLTPRGGLAWSSVDVDGFEDVKVEGYAGDRRVSLGSEDSFQGRVGVLAESGDGRLHASLDVEHEFSEDRDVMASGARLESEPESTWARLGLGFRVELDETGQAVLSGQGFYALADGDNRDYGASVALRARF